MYERRIAMLNAEQAAAANDLEGTSIIVAGAGTGKTQTLIHRLANLINSGIDPARICLLTFTNDAADTMKARAEKLGAKGISMLTACTYHSFCDRLMRRYNHLIGRPNDYTILEPSMVNDIVSIKLNEYKQDLKKLGITRLPTAKTVAALFSASINRDMPLEELVKTSPQIIKLCHNDTALIDAMFQTLTLVRENVTEYKIQKNLKDFDDMLLGAHDLLNDKTVRGLVNTIYQYILIDEYQDTNHLQAEIVHLLRDSNTNLVVVGDDFQSIYKFRGAEVKNFTDFPSEFKDVHEHKLIQNYRSTQEILDLANRVMEKHAKFGFKKNLVTGTGKHGNKPLVITADDQRREAGIAYGLIEKYKAEDMKNGFADRKTAVLYRGSTSSAYLEAMLSKNSKSYEKHGGVAFFDMECVQNVLSYMRVISNPFHELAWYRVLRIYTHIGDKRASDMAAMSDTLGFLGKVPHRYGNTKTAMEINEDLNLLEETIGLARDEETSHDMLDIIIKHYKEMYKRGEEKNENMRNNEEQVFEALDILLELSDCPEYEELNKWLDATTLREVDREKGDGTLILSTIHSAKGLEWDHVILLDCAENVFPRAENQEELDEELRCFYVAMTRAAETLDIIHPKHVAMFGSSMKAKLTPFLTDIGDGYFDTRDESRYF